MMIIDNEDIKRYRICPRFYGFSSADETHGAGRIRREQVLADRFENTLKQLFIYFFYKKQGGTIVSYASLLKRWDKLWFGKSATVADIIHAESPGRSPGVTGYSTTAAEVIKKFWNDFSDPDRDPFIIGEEYAIQVTGDIRVVGNFDIVLRNAKTKEVDILVWDLLADQNNAIIDAPLMKKAFDHRFQYDHEVRVWKGPYPKVEELKVSEEEWNYVEALIYEMAQSGIYLPRKYKNSFCSQCPYKTPCDNFKVTKEQVTWKRNQMIGTVLSTLAND